MSGTHLFGWAVCTVSASLLPYEGHFLATSELTNVDFASTNPTKRRLSRPTWIVSSFAYIRHLKSGVQIPYVNCKKEWPHRRRSGHSEVLYGGESSSSAPSITRSWSQGVSEQTPLQFIKFEHRSLVSSGVVQGGFGTTLSNIKIICTARIINRVQRNLVQRENQTCFVGARGHTCEPRDIFADWNIEFQRRITGGHLQWGAQCCN
jgi:hypothetical protein